MKMVVKESTMVKPAIEKPSSTLWLSNMDLIQPHFHLRQYFYYRSTGAADFFDSTVVKVALSRALVEFYPLAGRLTKDNNGRVQVYCNSEGVLFVEAESNTTLDDLGDFAPKPELSPPVDYSPGISTFPLFLVQVTRFNCGGVCIGIAIDHLLADGYSVFHFMKTWCDISRGLDIACPPSIDRRVLAARNPPKPQFTHDEYQVPPTMKLSRPQDTVFSMFKLTREQINALKANCQDEQIDNEKVTYSTFEVLSGHVWRSVTKARGVPDNVESRLYIPIDGRSRMQPPLPAGYFGNAVFKATCTALCGEMESNPLKFAVEKIHKAIAQMDDSYLRSAIDCLELQGVINHSLPKVNPNHCPNLGVNSFARFGIYDLDFGWGKPVYMGCVHLPEGTTILFPSPTNDGSLLYAISLPKDQMDAFKTLLYQI